MTEIRILKKMLEGIESKVQAFGYKVLRKESKVQTLAISQGLI